MGRLTGTSSSPAVSLNLCRVFNRPIHMLPQVANNVSSGRPYSQRMTLRSSTAPTRAEVKKATGIATTMYQSNTPGKCALNRFCTT